MNQILIVYKVVGNLQLMHHIYEDPETLREKYIDCLPALTINDNVNVLDFKAPEYPRLEERYNEKESQFNDMEERLSKIESLFNDVK